MNPTVEQLWLTFAGELLGFIRSRVKDPAAADDILQDVFLKIHQRLSSLRSAEKAQSWVYQIARNAIVDHVRSQTKDASVEHSAQIEFRAPISVAPATPDLSPIIRQFVDQLPKGFRDALIATEWEGLTQAEYAAKSGLSLSGAKSRVQRARAELRRLLDDCCRFELDRRGKVLEAVPRRANSPCDGVCC
jgi:RNA polymerase sigma-70 factor (ECF subfamily)